MNPPMFPERFVSVNNIGSAQELSSRTVIVKVNRSGMSLVASATLMVVLNMPAYSQHLYWKIDQPARRVRCVYGEIKVLVSGPATYFCGADWRTSIGSKRYSGIEDVGPNGGEVVFAQWDISPTRLAKLVSKSNGSFAGRFGGATGTGLHTHFAYNWSRGDVFKFCLMTKPHGQSEHTKMYFYDSASKKWTFEAEISAPLTPKISPVAKLVDSFIETWDRSQQPKPKLCLFRLWLGPSPSHLRCVSNASGDGLWGAVTDWYFIGAGEMAALSPVFQSLKAYGSIRTKTGGRSLSIRSLAASVSVVRALNLLK